MIRAEVVADSVNPEGVRLTTFKLRYPRIVHAEFMTHRKLSRNASGSRAVPNRKLRREALHPLLRAYPSSFGRNQRGMQAGEELTGPRRLLALFAWGLGAHLAVFASWLLDVAGAHKQVANRLLEPFTHINVVASSTEWENFFGLRLDAGADPTIRALAVAMWAERKSSAPQVLRPGQWHLPFCDPTDERDGYPIMALCLRPGDDGDYDLEKALLIAIKVSVARCARVSYESFETLARSTVEEDLRLYGRLVGAQPLHASPAEHQATPDEIVRTNGAVNGARDFYRHPREHGNFDGWRQHRKSLEGEAVAPLPEGF